MALIRKAGGAVPPETIGLSVGRTRGYNPADILAMIYLAGVCILILAAGREAAGWGARLAVYAALLGAVALLRFVPRRLPRVLQFLRESYTLFALPVAYGDLDWLNRLVSTGYYDEIVMRWDLALFGSHPHVYLSRMLPYPLLSDLLHACYLLYMSLVPVLGITLYLQNREHAFRVLATTVTLTMYSCYAFFIAFPVQGPYEFFGQPEGVPGLVPHLVYAMLNRGSSVGTAFPSSHVAGAITVAVMSTWFSRKLSHVMVALAFGIGIATIYGGFHYAIDAVAGFAYGLFLSFAGPRIHAAFLRQLRIPHAHFRFPHLRLRWKEAKARAVGRRRKVM